MTLEFQDCEEGGAAAASAVRGRDADQLAIAQLSWWLKSRRPSAFPFQDVLLAYRRKGKHFVAPEVTEELKKVRGNLEGAMLSAHPVIGSFLNVMLDKHDGRYDYRSYLALELLGLPAEETLTQRRRDPQPELDRSIVLLATDIVRFELDALDGKSTWLPQRAARQDLVETRCRRTLKALTPYLNRLRLGDLIDLQHPMQSASAVVQAVGATMSRDDELRLQLSHVPVYVVHDEYMFIRILQCFESVFAWICAQLRLAIDACAHDVATTVACLQQCCQHLQDASPFFHLLSTLDPESFKDFRTYTEGASAIQSRSYKRVESLCAKPADERLHSIAYHSVPEVQSRVLSGHETLDDTYTRASADGRHAAAEMDELRQVMEKFQLTLQRWRQSHYAIAVKMLGKGSGTGYTEGTPYLNEVRNIPVFQSINS